VARLQNNLQIKKREEVMNQEQVLGLLRHVLTVLGGGLVAKGFIEESILLEGVGLITSIIGIVWSIADKRKTK
jgi:hypothetical protein